MCNKVKYGVLLTLSRWKSLSPGPSLAGAPCL